MGVRIKKRGASGTYTWTTTAGAKTGRSVAKKPRTACGVRSRRGARWVTSLSWIGVASLCPCYAEQWLRSYAGVECKPSTKRSYEQLLRLHVTPKFGHKRLTEIRREQIKQHLGELSRASKIVDEKTGATAPRFSRNSLRLIVCALRTVLGWAD